MLNTFSVNWGQILTGIISITQKKEGGPDVKEEGEYTMHICSVITTVLIELNVFYLYTDKHFYGPYHHVSEHFIHIINLFSQQLCEVGKDSLFTAGKPRHREINAQIFKSA